MHEENQHAVVTGGLLWRACRQAVGDENKQNGYCPEEVEIPIAFMRGVPAGCEVVKQTDDFSSTRQSLCQNLLRMREPRMIGKVPIAASFHVHLPS